MTAKFDPADWNVALLQVQSPTATSAAATAAPLSAADERRREQLKVRVIEARVKLKLMRDRTDALKQALERFRTRDHASRA